MFATLADPMIQEGTASNAHRGRNVLATLSFAIGFSCAAVVLTFTLWGRQLEIEPFDVVTLAQLPAAAKATRIVAQFAPPDMRPFAKFALTSLQAELNYQKTRDTSMRAEIRNEFSHLDAKTKSKVLVARAETAAMAKEMSGVIAPTGFWDPLGFTTDVTEGKLLFYREAEMKHGRVCMLAALGLIVQEQFHPFYGGQIDVPFFDTFESVPLRAFWSHFWMLIAIHEVPSALTFEGMDIAEGGYGGVSTEWETNPVNYPDGPGQNGVDAFFGGKGVFYTMRKGRVAGDFSFDPLGLKPKDPAEFKKLQTKEISNGRLAMLATAGMLAQEMATGKQIF